MFDRLITSHWFQISLLLILLFTAVFMNFSHSRWREQIRNFTFDNYNIMKPREASDQVVVIDIDEASLQKIGQMPWPRTVMADLVKALKDMGVATITFDMVFAEPDRTSPDNLVKIFSGQPDTEDIVERLQAMADNDEIFSQAIGDAGNVITGFTFTQEVTDTIPAQKGIFRGQNLESFVFRQPGAAANQKNISKGAAGNGSFYITPTTDGIVRRVPMLVAYAPPETKIVSIYPSLTLETIRVLDGERGGRALMTNSRYAALNTRSGSGMESIQIGQNGRIIPTSARGEFLVYFAKHNPAWYIPAWKILDRSYPADQLKGKIAFIGTSAQGLKDLRSTPLDPFVSGTEVHLNIIDQILHRQYLTRSIDAEGLEALSILLAGLFIILCAPFIGTLAQAAVVIGVLSAGFYGGWYAFATHGRLIDVAYPAIAVLAIFMLSTILTYLRTQKEKQQVRQAFGLYISPAFMEELTRNPDKLKLGGEIRDLSVMFSDIRNFTAISEGLKPEELIQLMNDFLTPMSDLVMKNRGTIDKYIGDAMMAFWNAPLDDADHAKHACLTALSMQSALEPINKGIKARGGKTLLKVGIGINSGPCAVGNMGSRQRFAYSSLGDAVNLASRLEGQTKTYGVPIIIGETTYTQAPSLAALDLDLIVVKGKTKPVQIYALLGDEKIAQSEEYKALWAMHNQMMQTYRVGDFKRTLELLAACENAGFIVMEEAYKLYRERSEYFLKNPPEHWNGIYEAKGK